MHDEHEEHEEHTHEPMPLESWNPDFMELTSVGIDIGSSTSHLMFSRLLLQRKSVELSSRFEVVERTVVYRSPVLLTPYRDPETIDTEALAEFIERSYTEAGIDRSHVDTGAVICTGEAVKKKNAEAIIRLFSSEGGKFVCATAGPNLEAVLAAHGSGAVERSHGGTTLNVDVGGGTTKLAIVKDGAVVETGAINVGARLVAWDGSGRLDRIEEAGAKIARSVGVPVALGRGLNHEERTAMAETLADLLFEFVKGDGLSALATELLVTPLPRYPREASRVFFSGGVSEYIYGRESRDHGDLGPYMAEAIRRRLGALGLPVEESVEGLRATVIGASQYTVQVSSSTIFRSHEDMLPIRDLLVVTPRFEEVHLTAEGVAKAVERALVRFDLIEHKRPVALSLHWSGEISYGSMRTLGEGIVQAMNRWGNPGPLALVFDADIGGLVGAIVKEELAPDQDVIAVDEIDVGDFDFIDIGQELGHSGSVPVVVKSLVFKG